MLSAIMYERDMSMTREAVDVAQTRTSPPLLAAPNEPSSSAISPGSIIQSLFRVVDIKKILSILEDDEDHGERIIQDFVKEHGMCFAPISELKTTSQAYCSVFWDPTSTWVLVAFKYV